jgi:hypothetical protein
LKVNIIIVALGTLFFLIGCVAGTKVTMTQDKYTPAFKSGEFSRLKGKKLVLSNFINQAQNTKTYDYFSADKKVTYETSASLESYFWYCFQKDFKHVGVNLVDYNHAGYYGPHSYWWGAPPPQAPRAAKGVPEFQLVILSITDQEFKFKAFVFKDGQTKFAKAYSVTMPAAGTENVADLEKRSYRLVDLAFTTIMKDREFQKAL